jgi:hypothetical protein
LTAVTAGNLRRKSFDVALVALLELSAAATATKGDRHSPKSLVGLKGRFHSEGAEQRG